MKKKLLKKIRSAKAFSMSEMLVATLILGLMTTAMASGISASIRIYHDSVTYSEKRMLLSTLAESISTELRYAKEAEVKSVSNPEDKKYQLQDYTSPNFGFDSKIEVSSDGRITVKGSDLVGDGVYSKNKLLSACLIDEGSSEKQSGTAKIYYYESTETEVRDYYEFTVAVYSGDEETPETRTLRVKPLDAPTIIEQENN